MRIIGLTGGIACGKSTVTAVLQSEGVRVIDCDLISRQVVQPGQTAYNNIVAAFGTDILLPDGNLDRPLMRSIVFDDPKKRRLLSGAIGSQIQREIFVQLFSSWCSGSRIVVIDAPTLYETQMQWMCAEVVVVALSEEAQLQRVMNRDKCSESAARKIMNAQLPTDQKVAQANRVLWNDGTIQEVQEQTRKLVSSLNSQYGGGNLLLSGPGLAAVTSMAILLRPNGLLRMAMSRL